MTKVNLTILLLIATFSVSGQSPMGIKVEQPKLKSLFVWDSLIIAEKDRAGFGKYYVCDKTKGKLSRLQIGEDTAILALAESRYSLYAIVQRGSSYILLSKNKRQNHWVDENLFSGFSNLKEFRFVASDSMFVMVSYEKIYTKRLNADWQEIAMDTVLDKSSMMFRRTPEHCVLTLQCLFIGSDDGEWGGALWEIPVSKEAETFKGKLILEDNIKALDYSSGGVLWIATGLAHLGLRRSEIYKYDGGRLQQVLWSRPSLSLSRKSDLSAFCLKNKEEPFFIASELGVFRIVNERLKVVLKNQFYLKYRTQDYEVGSDPVGMYVDKYNTLYVAQRSLGVFVYTLTPEGYKVRQLTFD